MSRIRTLFSTVLPSMIAGGLLFSSAFGQASAGRDELGFWPAGNDATSPGTSGARPTPPAPPKAPPPPAPARPAPPAPPAPPGDATAGEGAGAGHGAGHGAGAGAGHGAGHGGSGISVTVNNGKVQIDGVKDLALRQVDLARDTIRSNTKIPKDVRDKLLSRLDKVRATLERRLGNLNVSDLDQLGHEMDKMGEEISQAMDGLDADMSKLGDQLGKDLAKQFGKQFGKNFGNFNIHVDNDDDDEDDVDADIPTSLDVEADDEDLKEAISDLKDLALKPTQKEAISKLRADSDRAVASAKKQMDDLSAKLHTALGNSASTDADIGRYVDQISAQEATIRKARILAWVQARRVLDVAQRKRIEDAAHKKTK